jgi:uncharacterized membrane protein YbhN (UPF0104 family)
MWIGLALSAVFIAIFVLRTDFSEIGDAFAHANYWWALAALPVYFTAAWFRAWRWKYLLRPLGEMRVSALYPIVIIGFMANNLIPARAGELVRAYIVGERAKVSKMAALGTIAVDRVFDGITLLPILLIGLLVMVALALSQGFSRWVVRLALRLTPSRLRAQVEGLVESFLTGLHSFRNPADMLAASITSLISWLLEATMYYMVGLAFDLGVGFHVYLLVAAGANLAIAVIATQGGVGPFEVVARETVAFFGVESGVASAYAVALHALLLIPVIALGLYFLWAINLSLGDVLRGRVAATEPAGPNISGKESGGR